MTAERDPRKLADLISRDTSPHVRPQRSQHQGPTPVEGYIDVAANQRLVTAEEAFRLACQRWDDEKRADRAKRQAQS
jgi:hypothetical protein